MSEEIQPAIKDTMKSPEKIESASMHTCACGERHLQEQGGLSHLETCASPKKFGETCCCGSGHDKKVNYHQCSQK